MIGIVETVSVFLSASAHRTNALIGVIEELGFSESKKQRLKALCPTRWVERHDSLITFKELLIPVVTVLEDLSLSRNVDASAKAYMLISAIKRSDFVVGLNVAVYCLSLTLRLSQVLQSPKQDLSSALANVDNVLKMLKDARCNAEMEFSEIFQKSNQVADELGFNLSMPRTCKRQTQRENVPATTTEEYFRRTIFVPLVDHFISEMEARFNRDFHGILPLEGLIPANMSKFSDIEILNAALKYESFIDELNSSDLIMTEIKMWRNRWKEASYLPLTVMESLKELDIKFFPSIGVLQVFGTIPVTTSSAERSFSILKRLKSYLRSSMGESRLNGLALANISKHREVSVDKITDLFSQTKKRRMCLENWEQD